MMVGNNLKDVQLQQIVDKTILYADKDQDGKISFSEFSEVKQREIYENLFPNRGFSSTSAYCTA